MNAWVNWKLRHQHGVNLWLHALGIPLTLAAVVLALHQLSEGQWGLWWRPVALLVGGYLLQWWGHRIEGNTMGELILIRKWRKRPYVAVAPQYRQETPGTPARRPPGPVR